jgi:hypothetical protein
MYFAIPQLGPYLTGPRFAGPYFAGTRFAGPYFAGTRFAGPCIDPASIPGNVRPFRLT